MGQPREKRKKTKGLVGLKTGAGANVRKKEKTNILVGAKNRGRDKPP